MPSPYILYSFWTVILFCLPFWWISTSIERLPLRSISPSSLASLEALRFYEKVVIRLAPAQGESGAEPISEGLLTEEIRRELDRLGRVHGGDQIELVTGSAWDDLYKAGSSSPPWEVVVSPSSLDAPSPSASLGDSTLSVQASPESSTHLPSYIAKSLVGLFPTSEDLLDTQDHKAAKFSDHYTLAFTLLIEDVTEGENPSSWEIEKSLAAIIQPLLTSLSPLHTFTLESQIQYHSPLSITPILEEATPPKEGETVSSTPESVWVVGSDDTKAFVNSEQWALGSQGVVDDGPTLQFMVFVPRGERRPLGFETESTETLSTSFLIPQQGSLVIHNPLPSQSRSSSALTYPLLAPLLQTHLAHLCRLLGIPPPLFLLSAADPTPAPLTKWQLSHLARLRTAQNVRDAVGGLTGLQRLVGKIGEMRVGEKVRGDVEGAVRELEEMVRGVPSRERSPLELFPHSARALALSSRAFFNPTMLGLLYFPDEHKYAVYTPLFAPAGVPVVVALVKHVKKRRAEAAAAKKKQAEEKKEEKDGVVVEEKPILSS